MSRTIRYMVTASATHLPMAKGESPTHIPTAIGRGMQRFRDFLDIQIINSSGGFFFSGADLTRKNAWAIYRRPWNCILNTQVQRWGKTWSLLGCEIVAPHEVGHGVLSYQHLNHLQDYYNDPKFSHVMKIGAGTYMYSPGAFSPAEIQIMLQKGYILNKRPTHPYALVHRDNLRKWNSEIVTIREQLKIATGSTKLALEKRINDLNTSIANDTVLAKKIILLYPYHVKMFSWQTEKSTQEARALADANQVEKIYAESVREAESGRIPTEIGCSF